MALNFAVLALSSSVIKAVCKSIYELRSLQERSFTTNEKVSKMWSRECGFDAVLSGMRNASARRADYY
jgi:hypothetical protein